MKKQTEIKLLKWLKKYEIWYAKYLESLKPVAPGTIQPMRDKVPPPPLPPELP